MVFKLLRTDSDEPCKIQLPVGKHLIGRGKFLDCEDKRVSRNHGELEVLSDTVVIKALHQNPCFVIRKGTEEVQIVKQNCIINLDNGDKFGLLPNTYWYELLHCAFADIDKDDGKIQSQCEDTSSTATEPMYCATEPVDGGTEPTESETVPMEEEDVPKNDESQEFDFELNDTVEDNITGSPSLLPTENQLPTESPSTPKRRLSSGEPNADEGSDSPPKRSHSPQDESGVKKIKTEPEVKKEPEVKTEPRVKTEPGDVAPGPSNDQAASTSPNDKDANLKAPQAQQNPQLRERCMYGANCYRKNPQHKAQFSHPTDSDWGAGAQAPCPYGAGCRRTDPRHWRDHSHPPGVQPQPQGQPARNFQPNPGNKKKKPKPQRKSVSDDDDDGEDSPASNNIVHVKRTRKTINRTTNWSGSESENEDPYQTDESDEWQPTSDMTDSQLYSQDFSQI
ncbi:hypothetical protein ABMA28_004831 [Loxostege sticticalis]|uniref:Aprataxin and PNK-like factor n=1 Tax=Loxostege sticticalis TaxID=481309 RepID=A0ABD0SSK6_LOXSC